MASNSEMFELLNNQVLSESIQLMLNSSFNANQTINHHNNMYQFFARVNGSPSLNHQININNNQKSTLLSADVEYENSNDENENPNRPKTGATKLEFIQDSTVSANRKKKT
jgi:hypothetical protein